MKFLKKIGIIIFMVAMAFIVSWFMTCIVIKLITLCFGLTFSLRVATGVWLVLILIKTFLKQLTNK